MDTVFVPFVNVEMDNFKANGLTCDVAKDSEIPDPVGDFIRGIKLQPLEKSNGDAAWRDQLAGIFEGVARATSPADLEKVHRREVVTIDGEKWSHGYNVAGELIDARFILG
jgi:hypothetical protein